MSQLRLSLCAAAILVWVLTTSTASAYLDNYPAHSWPNYGLNFNVRHYTHPEPHWTEEQYGSILRAILSWDESAVPGSRFKTNPQTIYSEPFGTPFDRDGLNSIVRGTLPAGRNDPAYTLRQGTTVLPYVWFEADIIINDAWRDYLVPRANQADPTPSSTGLNTGNALLYSTLNLESIVRHEIGHVAGFGGTPPDAPEGSPTHETQQVSSNLPYYSFGMAKDIWMHGDDRNALRTKYQSQDPPPPGGWEMDFAILGWKLNGQYGAGTGDKMDPVISPSPSTIPAGGEIAVEYTIENLGTVEPDGGAVSLGFYLDGYNSGQAPQRDGVLSATELIASRTVNTPPPATGGVLTKPWRTESPLPPIQIPCNTTPGQYYLGVILDYDHNVTERREDSGPEDNNTLLLPYSEQPLLITVTSPAPGCSDGGQPGKARNVAASDGTHCGVKVTWEAPSSGSIGAAEWQIYRNGNHFVGVDRSPHLYWTIDTGATPGQTYSYTVQAADPNTGQYVGPISDPDDGYAKTNTLPSPSEVTASQDRSDGILVTWSWPSGTANPDGFDVIPTAGGSYPALAGTARSYLVPALLGPNSYRVRSFTNADMCYSQSIAVEGRSWSTSFSSISVSINAPDCDAPTVSWSYAGNVLNVQGYKVYRDNVLVYTASPAEPSWVDLEATAAHHTYWVDVYNPVATRRSNTVEIDVVRAPLTAPSQVSVATVQSGTCCEALSVSWTWGGSEFAFGFVIYRDGQSVPIDTVNSFARSWSDFDVAPGSYHSYRVAGYSLICGAGASSIEGSATLCTEPSQWIPNGLPISGAAGAQLNVRTVAAPGGGAFLVWEDYRSGSSDVYVQKISEGGNACWGGDGVAVCNAQGDQTRPTVALHPNGGVAVVWEDRRSGSSDIYGQIVRPDGTVQWANNGLAVCAAAGDQLVPSISSSGNSILYPTVVWEDLRSGTGDIYGRLLDANGPDEGWPTGFPVCTAAGPQRKPVIAGAPSTHTIVTWEDSRSGRSDIYMQRVRSDGLPVWAIDGVAVAVAPEDQLSPSLVSWPLSPGWDIDAAGIAWTDERSGPSVFDVYAQIVHLAEPNDGYSFKFASNGIRASIGAATGTGVPSLSLAPDQAGGLFLAWDDYRGADPNIYAQRVTWSGDLSWSGGRPICTAAGAQGAPVVASDGQGGAIVAWADRRGGIDYDVFARRIAGDGSLLGGINGTVVALLPGDQQAPMIAEGTTGGAAVVAWQDSRSGNADIYAHRTAPQGTQDIDLTRSFYVPEAGPVGTELTKTGMDAVKFFRTCPNNDGTALPQNARIRIRVCDATGVGIPGIAESDIFILFNGGTLAQGFSGPGADSIIANSVWNQSPLCPDMRRIESDAPTDANGTTYITFKGKTPGSPGVGTRDPVRKWGHYDSDIPVFALGQRLTGRLAEANENGTYQLQIKNADYTGGLTANMNQGEYVTSADYNGVANNINAPWNPIYYWRDFDWNGSLNSTDLNYISSHQFHSCQTPPEP